MNICSGFFNCAFFSYIIYVVVSLLLLTPHDGSATLSTDSVPFTVVSLQFRNQHLCIGVMISKFFLLTAAICVCKAEKLLHVKHIHVIAAGKSERHKIQRITCHPLFENFQPFGSVNDMAVIELSEPVELAWPHSVIANHPDFHKPKSDCHVISLNKNNNSIIVSKARLTSREQCNIVMTNNELETHNLCTLLPKFEMKEGDEGAPLICNDRIVGIYSWKYPPRTERKWELLYAYTSIPYQLQFIKKIKNIVY